MFVVLTLRTDESPREPAVGRFVAELGRRAEQHVVLRPLTRDEQARQVSDILGVPPTRALLDEVYQRAEGNPFFAEELLALGHTGRLPPTLRDLLLTRLEALPPATQNLLRTAAVVGRRVPHRLLEAVSDLSPERLEAALRPAVEGHVLVTDPEDGGSYEFRHALLHEAVAASLLPGEAARMHRRLADTLTHSPDLASTTQFVEGRVARHWFAAGDQPQALVASVAAAHEAKRALAFSESLAHFERAVALLDTVPQADDLLDEPRYWLLWSAAEVAHLSGNADRAQELVRAAIDVVDVEDPNHHGYLYERLGRYLWMGADGIGALAAYERAVELVPSDPPTRWRAAVLSGYSQILMLASRFQDCAVVAREAIAVAEQVPDARSVEGHARCNLGVALARLGDLDAGVTELVEARRIAEEQFDDVDDIARAIVNLESVYADAGRLEDAARTALEAVSVVDRLGLQRRKGVWCRCDAGSMLLALGRYDDTASMVQEAQELAPQGVDAVATDLLHGGLLIRLGRFGEARARLEAAHAAGGQLLDGQLVGPLYAALVEVATWLQDFPAASAWADEGTARLDASEDAAYAVPLFAAAVQAEVERSLAARGRRVADDPAGSASRWITLAQQAVARTPAETPAASALLAGAQCELARLTSADEPGAWSQVASAWEELGDPYRMAYALLREAGSLLRTSTSRSRGRDPLRRAHATATGLGARGLVTLCEELAARARLELRPTKPGGDHDSNRAAPYRLTPRELEVLALVADGLTDREIGARLFISHRTVERHVSNLLAKLDASRRTQLTLAAERAGLLG